MNKKSISRISDDSPKVTQREIDRSVFRIGLKPTQKKATSSNVIYCHLASSSERKIKQTERDMKEVFACKVDKNGRITLPLKLRQHLGLHPGDYVSLRFKDNEIFLAKAQKPIHK